MATTKLFIQDGEEMREYTAAEYAQAAKDAADALAAKTLQDAELAAAVTAKEALLKRLGITADEAKLLLG